MNEAGNSQGPQQPTLAHFLATTVPNLPQAKAKNANDRINIFFISPPSYYFLLHLHTLKLYVNFIFTICQLLHFKYIF